MNVCIVGPAYPYRGGIAHFTSVLAREFAKDHHVDIINYQRLYPSFLFPGRTQYDESNSPLRVESERIIDSINPLSWRRAAARIAELRPDLVVVKWWQPFFAPALRSITSAVQHRTGSPVVFLCHNVLPHESSIVDRVLARHGLGRADAYLLQSSEDEQKLQSILPGSRTGFNPHPMYDWFNMGHYSRDQARESLGVTGRVLLFFGLVRSYKGVDVLLRAFARVGEKLDATLLIVGEFYEDRVPYETLISELDIGDRVRIVDRYVPNEEVEKYFKASDLVVLPYRSATQSGIVQTAFSFKIPVIVTRVGGLPDVVIDGKTGYIVPPDDPPALGAAIRRFFDEGAAERMSAGIREDAERFSWRHCVEALIRLGDRSQ
ncbi:MAG: glycosyltransferase [Candidatus Krumholzibacteriota bacterium]|nr:glycosyltransferase [Candidatus Krumholzibacteriota bacterium]